MSENKYKPTLLDYWTGDNTREGYDRGFSDGESNKTANPAGYSHIRKFNFVWAFNHAADTYSQGYRNGHTDGMRKRNGLYSSVDINSPILNSAQIEGVAMSDLNSFNFQKKCCEQMVGNLQNLIAENRYVLGAYSDKVDLLKSQGFFSEFWKDLDASLELFRQDVDALVTEASRHVDAFNGQIAWLNNKINELGG